MVINSKEKRDEGVKKIFLNLRKFLLFKKTVFKYMIV